MGEFNTIFEKHISAELVEKKSKFIANLFYVETSEEAENMIKEVKKKYFDAKHNCFAYLICNNNEIEKRFSDDGEPSGTAGAPMMEILEKQNLCNVVVVVTRYFGGILLGTGGLVRAYSDSLKLAIEKASIVTQQNGYEVNVEVSYSDLEKFKYYCNKNNINIIGYEFLNNVFCKIEANDEDNEEFLKEHNPVINFEILSFNKIRQKNISKMSKNVE